MAIPCPEDCPAGVTWDEFLRSPEIVRAYLEYCAEATLASTVVDVGGDPAINVNIVAGPTVVGTSAFGGLNIVDDSGDIPLGWSSFTVSNNADSASNILVGTVEVVPGLSISHGTWDGFPGEVITVTSPDVNTFATVTWVIPTVTP